VKDELEQTLGDLLDALALSQAAVGVRESRVRGLDERGAPVVERMQARNALAFALGGAGDKARAVSLYGEVIAALDGATDKDAVLALIWAYTQRAMLGNEIAGG
jgi:hypothetical protein